MLILEYQQNYSHKQINILGTNSITSTIICELTPHICTPSSGPEFYREGEGGVSEHVTSTGVCADRKLTTLPYNSELLLISGRMCMGMLKKLQRRGGGREFNSLQFSHTFCPYHHHPLASDHIHHKLACSCPTF